MAFPNPNEFEVLAAIRKVKGVKGKLLVVTCYAPPNMGSLKADGLVIYLSDLIAEVKRVRGDVLIAVSGDFNQWPIRT